MRGWWRAVAVAAVFGAGCGVSGPVTDRKLVVLAVDGLDPELTERLIGEGRLPHLAELARTSGVVRVTPTPGAEAAGAWASFATGVHAGKHGIFATIAPDPETGRPIAATLRPKPSARWLGWWTEGAAYQRVRAGEPFWSRLGAARIRPTILFVPGTFPPEPIPNGTGISGTPLPDWGGGLGAGYTFLGSDIAPDQTGPTRYGGRVERLTFSGNVAHATLVGIRAPERRDVPLTVTWNPEARSANIAIGSEAVFLAEGQQSRWIELSMPLNFLTRIGGLVRLHLLRAGGPVHLWVSPIQWHPYAPPSPISEPAGAASALFERLGPYRTLTWPAAGWALADGWITEDAFLVAQRDTFTDRAETLLNRVDSQGWDLIVAGVDALATTERLLWRVIDPGHGAHDPALVPRFSAAIPDMYRRLDDLVGAVRARLPPGADLAVVSAYGVYTARHIVDLNRWLTSEGLLVWRDPPRPVTLAALAEPEAWADTVDWTATAARAVGPGHIYVNRRRHAPSGAGDPDAGDEAVLARLSTRLEALTDPVSGRRVVARVRRGRELFQGPYATQAPDLVVTFSPGYRVSWDTMLGGMSDAIITRNRERFSADHASMDELNVPGVWLSSMPITADAIDIVDVAPSILAYFGSALPADADGIARLARPLTP